MNAHLPVVRPLLCYARQGGNPHAPEKQITSEETIKILLEEWLCVYGASKESNSDEDVRVLSDIGSYKRVLRSLNVKMSTGILYAPRSNPLCEQQIRVLKENVRI